VRLLELIPIATGLQGLRADMAVLSAYAVEFRYPGEQASREVAKGAIAVCRVVRKDVRLMLGLD